MVAGIGYDVGNPDPKLLYRLCVEGLGRPEMAVHGGEISADNDGYLTLPLLPAQPRRPSACVAKGAAARSKAKNGSGLLVEWTPEQQCRVLNFAAGHVLDCEAVGPGELRILVQPCLLQTSTALTRPESP